VAVAGEPVFTVDVAQNEYLPAGAGKVSALVTVTALETAAGPACDEDAAEIIIVDCSASMGTRPAMMASVRRAVAAAVDVISNGVEFAIVAGADRARQVYPAEGGLAVASPDARGAAKAAAAGLSAGGSAAMGQWLRLARDLFTSSPALVRHAILLAGSRDSESPQELDAAIAYCEGVFSCDCRGMGTDWEVSEIRKISTVLLGTVDIILDPDGLLPELVTMMQIAMRRRVADVSLRLWTPQSATVLLVKQVTPDIRDLTVRRSQAGRQIGDYPTGAWAARDSRDYQLSIQAVPAQAGQEMLVARVSMVAMSASGAQVLGQGLVRAVWTDDAELPARISPRLAAYSGQAELAQLIEDGLNARKQEDLKAAAVKLGEAVTAALRLGRTDTLRLLAEVVDVVDADTGEVRLKRDVTAASGMALDIQSARTRWAGLAAVASPEPTDFIADPRALAGHVFISYVHENSGQVDQLQAMLHAAGIPV